MQRVALVLLIAVIPCFALGSVVKPMSLKQLAVSADAIVHGRVLQSETIWNENKTRIFTLTTVRVTEEWKGALGDEKELVIRQVGGSIGPITQAVAGNAVFQRDEELVLFLERSKRHADFMVIGLSLGQFVVDRHGGQQLVRHRSAGLAELRSGSGVHHLEPPKPAEQFLTLQGLKLRVTEFLRSP